MTKENEHSKHARILRADIIGSPDVWLPRRADMLDWLNAFVLRSEKPAFSLEETEAADLNALDLFLRKERVPAALA